MLAPIAAFIAGCAHGLVGAASSTVALSSPTSTAAVVRPRLQLGSEPFDVKADRLFGDLGRRDFLAEGRVLLHREGLWLRADRLRFLEPDHRATAEGHVQVVEASNYLTCERMVLDSEANTGRFSGAELRIGTALTPEVLAQQIERAQPIEGGAGKEELRVTAESLERLSPRRFAVEAAQFTLCHCPGSEPPSWHVKAGRADVDLDSGALLFGATFFIRSVPFFYLPAFYLPLGDRRSGLLLPHMGFGPLIGTQIAEPFFLALGRSYDATLDLALLSARGWRPSLEGRWATSVRSTGQLRAALLFDEGVYDPSGRGYTRSAEHPLRRFAVTGKQRTYTDAGQIAVDINVVGDPNYPAEFADAVTERQTEESVSRATFSTADRFGDRIAVGLALRQDLRPITYSGVPDLRAVRLLSADLPGPGLVRDRLFELRIDAAPRPLWTGAPLIGEARFSTQGFIAPNPSVPRFLRADARPAIMTTLMPPGGWIVLVPELAGRLSAWTGADGGRSASAGRAAAIVRTTLFTEFGRDFGSLRHRIRPEFADLLIPGVAGRPPTGFAVGDEIDLLAPVHQIRGRVISDLWDRKSGRRVAAFELGSGRDLGIGGHPGDGNSPLTARAEVDLLLADPISTRIWSGAAIGSRVPQVEEFNLGASLNLGPRLSFMAEFAQLGTAVPRSSFLAPEELVPSRTIARTMYLDPSAYAAARAAGRLDVAAWSGFDGVVVATALQPIDPLSLSFSANFAPPVPAVVASHAPDGFHTPAFIRNVTAAVRWSSPCECWGIGLTVIQSPDRPRPDFSFLFDLGRLGQTGL